VAAVLAVVVHLLEARATVERAPEEGWREQAGANVIGQAIPLLGFCGSLVIAIGAATDDLLSRSDVNAAIHELLHVFDIRVWDSSGLSNLGLVRKRLIRLSIFHLGK